MTPEEEAALRAEVEALRQEVEVLREALSAALERIAELERGRKGPPSFVKANRPRSTQEKRPRRKRKAEQNGSRKREAPTKVVRHALKRCPACGYKLRGRSIARRRQVIELPPPQAVEVTEHQVIKRWCPHCGRWHSPKLDLRGQVLGQGRIGVRLVGVIACLRSRLRLPYRQIQEYVRTMHGLEISVGELVEVLHQMKREVAPALSALRQEVRASAIVYSDETGWRENGQNGYVWGMSTAGPNAARYYEYDRSRAHWVVERLLGKEFRGVLVSDFYAAYNAYLGPHQRCWVHLLRDLHELQEEHPHEDEVIRWVQGVRALYDDAQAWLKANPRPSQAARQTQYVALLARLQPLGLAYAQSKGHACQALAKRLLRHQDELFQFVLVQALSADNNLSERSLRPLVVARKISGGTRSQRGSATRMALHSLFETWQARGLNALHSCLQLLTQTPLPQV
jgi:transposase